MSPWVRAGLFHLNINELMSSEMIANSLGLVGCTKVYVDITGKPVVSSRLMAAYLGPLYLMKLYLWLIHHYSQYIDTLHHVYE